MVRFYDAAAWFLSSLGVALLLCTALLFPTQAALAYYSNGCAALECDNGCIFRTQQQGCQTGALTCSQGSNEDCSACTCANVQNNQNNCACTGT